MHEVAKRNDTVRFVKMDNDIAEIDPTGVPAVIAYKAGNKFADIMSLPDALPRDSEVSAVSLETLLRQYVDPPITCENECQLTETFQKSHPLEMSWR